MSHNNINDLNSTKAAIEALQKLTFDEDPKIPLPARTPKRQRRPSWSWAKAAETVSFAIDAIICGIIANVAVSCCSADDISTSCWLVTSGIAGCGASCCCTGC
eukprot:SAG31_NODE_20761_length_566_cov_0.618844_1_plen_102_part_10